MGDIFLEHGNHFGHCHAIRGIGAFVIGLRSLRTWYLSLVSPYLRIIRVKIIRVKWHLLLTLHRLVKQIKTPETPGISIVWGGKS